MSQDARTLAINETDLIRMMEVREAFFGGAVDAKRPTAWLQYGYPDQVTFPMLLAVYSRRGLAVVVIHRRPNGTRSPNSPIRR